MDIDNQIKGLLEKAGRKGDSNKQEAPVLQTGEVVTTMYIRCERKGMFGTEKVCGGELVFSHRLPDLDRTCYYKCKKCGRMTELI